MAKLLMITGIGSAKDLASGRQGAFYNTLEEFHKYWERVDIISPKIKGLESGVRNLFDNVFIHISPWPLVFHPFWFLKKGLEIYKEQKFDLMTVHEFPPFYNGIGARLLWQKIKVPYVLEIHHVPGHPKAANLKEGIYRSLMKWFIKFDASKATVVRVVNQNQTPEFLKRAGVPEKKITYMPSMYIDLETFKPMNMKKEYDLIFVGRLEPNKGIGLLLEAASKLMVKSEKLKVLIVGDGPLTKSLKLRVKSLKLENNIIFYGRAKDSSEIAQLLNESKILVMPSYNEGGPRVVLEAMACEVPVLVTL
ncbi:MAG: glycosyltransferase, partial [bacterium]|nr:glycosyltransferase [bacterium]